MSDVLVIGAGISGLVAATYLARAGAHVVVLESGTGPGGACANRVPVGDFAVPGGPHVLTALDPRMIKDLNLTRHGLKFSVRDLPLIGLRPGSKPLFLGRDVREAQRSIAPVSPRDAARFAGVHRDLFAFGRAMRPQWWEEGILKHEAARAQLHCLRVTSAVSWLENAFESEALRAAFAFDALNGGLSPSAAGTSLIFAWGVAQEMCGLQGAVAIPRGGPAMLVEAVAAAAQAAGVEVRPDAEVVRLKMEGEAVQGAVLASGELVHASIVLSSLSRRKTLLELLPPGMAGFAAARVLEPPQETGQGKVVLALNSLPFVFKQPGRFVVAERLEAAVSAHAEARAGALPSDLILEVVPLDAGPSAPVLLSVIVRPLPITPAEDWKTFSTRLVQNVLRILEHHAPDIAANVTAFALVPPKVCDPWSAAHLLMNWRQRIETPVRGVYLCGEAAEPFPAVSGRAARIASDMAVRHLKETRS